MNAPVRHRSRKAANAERPQGHDLSMRTASSDDAHIRVLRDYTQQHQLDDPFVSYYGTAVGGGLSIIEPTYSFYSLMRMPEENSMLRQCIDAMITNIDGHGYRLAYIGPEGQEASPVAEQEKAALENFFDFPNDEYSLQEMRDRLRRDFETLGNCYIEVGRDRTGRVVMMSHIPAHTVRLTTRDTYATEVNVLLPRDGKTITQKVNKRFRRFVQLVGTRRVYFKEYGDPRSVDPTTGQVVAGLSLESSATEIIHISHYNPAGPYGLPRWFHQLPAIMGSRQAEMTNLDFFKENAIPAMALLVSGGMVTQSSIDQMEAHFLAARGRQSMNRILVLEATGDDAMMNDNGQVPIPKVELKPLQGDRQGDGLFQNYEKASLDKIRSAFRLPPLFVGLTTDYTYATAKTSYEVAEGQVFAPERQRFDDMFNLKILSTYGVRFWAFRSNPPRLSDTDTKIKAIETFDKVGAMTPNISLGLANELFDLDLPAIESTWGNYPFQMVRDMIRFAKTTGDGGQIEIDTDMEQLNNIPTVMDGAEVDATDTNESAEQDELVDGGGQTAEKASVAVRRVRRDLLGLRRAIKAAIADGVKGV